MDGRTVHVPCRLISGAIYHISCGFEAGGKNIDNAKQTGNKQNLGWPVRRLHEKGRPYGHDVKPSASSWALLMFLLDSGPEICYSVYSLLTVQQTGYFLALSLIDTTAVLHIMFDCLRLFISYARKPALSEELWPNSKWKQDSVNADWKCNSVASAGVASLCILLMSANCLKTEDCRSAPSVLSAGILPKLQGTSTADVPRCCVASVLRTVHLGSATCPQHETHQSTRSVVFIGVGLL